MPLAAVVAKDTAFELTLAKVKAVVTFPLPSTDDQVAVPSPVKAILIGLAHFVLVEALPVKAAVIVPAVKFPLASRLTIVDAVFKFVALLICVV